MNEKEKKRNSNRQREKEREIAKFSIMRFDSATSNFLELIVIKSYRKTEKRKI